jgi:hypothetical protein
MADSSVSAAEEAVNKSTTQEATAATTTASSETTEVDRAAIVHSREPEFMPNGLKRFKINSGIPDFPVFDVAEGRPRDSNILVRTDTCDCNRLKNI